MSFIALWYERSNKKKPAVSAPYLKMVLVQVIAIHPIPCPHHSHIHAIPYFLVGIICGPRRRSFPVRDHLRSNLGIICGPGSFAVLGSFAVQFGDHLRPGIISGPGSFAVLGSFAVRDHLRSLDHLRTRTRPPLLGDQCSIIPKVKSQPLVSDHL